MVKSAVGAWILVAVACHACHSPGAPQAPATKPPAARVIPRLALDRDQKGDWKLIATGLPAASADGSQLAAPYESLEPGEQAAGLVVIGVDDDQVRASIPIVTAAATDAEVEHALAKANARLAAAEWRPLRRADKTDASSAVDTAKFLDLDWQLAVNHDGGVALQSLSGGASLASLHSVASQLPPRGCAAAAGTYSVGLTDAAVDSERGVLVLTVWVAANVGSPDLACSPDQLVHAQRFSIH